MTTAFELELTLAYSERRRALAKTTGEVLAIAFAALPHLNEENVSELAARASAARQGQTAAAALFVAYTARLGGSGLIVPAQVPIPPPEWRSPFISHWNQLKNGATWADARDAGIRQAEAVGYDASIRAADHVIETGTTSSNVRGWRRVLVGETCAWCRRVAGPLYKTKDSALRVRHNRCDCEVVPVVGETDPGEVINADRRDAPATDAS